MANWRVQVANYAAGALPQDKFVNTLYFTGDAPSGAQWDTLFDALVAAWTAHPATCNRHFTLTAYNMGDPKPRPIVRQKLYSATDLTPLTPSEVCLCLSYYATRNLPKLRGRIYIGPLTGAAAFPTSTVINGNIALGTAIHVASLVPNLLWSVHSVKDNDYSAITDLWVDNAWDTQRRRGAKATSRTTGHLT